MGTLDDKIILVSGGTQGVGAGIARATEDLVGVGLTDAQPEGNIPAIAESLFTDYLLAFEVTSALLITAALGAMVLAHRERLSKRKTQGDLVGERMKRYADTGQHPGPLPTPGVYARHNAVDTPAMLPDGTLSELSVSATLRNRSGGPAVAQASAEQIQERIGIVRGWFVGRR